MNRKHARGWMTAMMLTGLGLMAGIGPVFAQDPATESWDKDLGPVSIVTNDWVDVREVLRSVAANAGMGLQMAPDVAGDVNIHLENVPLGQALEAVLDPVGMGYQVMGDVLVIRKKGMVTRWFKFDYPVTLREGRGELEISAGSEESSGGGGGGGEGGEGGGTNQNKSHVTSTATMSVWPEVMEALKVLVFRGNSAEETSAQNQSQMSASLSDSKGRTLVINPMASLIHVTAEFDRVSNVEQLLIHLEQSLQRQVAIEVRIMEVALDSDTQTGVNWETFANSEGNASLTTLGNPANLGDSFFQFVVDSKHMTGVFQALATSGDLKSISTPRITTLNNQKAVVRVVKEDIFYQAQVEPAIITNGVASEPVVNYTAQTVSVGVVLDVTPQVSASGTITLNVHPTISDITGIAESPNLDTAPILAVRELDTVGKVQAGQTLVIAGLISERTQQTRSGVPILKDLPLLGYLFGKTGSKKSNIELVMLLTPTLLEGHAINVDADEALAKIEGTQ